MHDEAPLVESTAPITLIGGGQVTARDMHKALTLAPVCVAADGGAARALAAGVTPAAVIGDMDSLPPDSAAAIPQDRQHKVIEQDSTDFDKALRHIAAPVVIGVGFCGGRLDHQLAALHTLVHHADRPCILLSGAEIVFHAPPMIQLDCDPGTTLSLFPLGPVTGRSAGLEWPIDGLAFDPMQKIGTSNRAVGPVTLWMDGHGMLVIAPSTLIPQAVSQLGAADARWPARAAR